MDEARLSRLLFEAREWLEMYADVVDRRSGRDHPDGYLRTLVAQIDAYRAEQGWSPNGFGGEGEEVGPRFPCGCPAEGLLHDPQICKDWDEFRP